MLVLLFIILLIVAFGYFFMRTERFGSPAGGARLQKMQQSPHYKNGQFQNISHTPALTEGVSYYSVFKKFFFEKKERRIPTEILPSKKTNLLQLKPDENVLVWFGHSSYFMQIDGRKILVDPVLSGNASPLSFTTKSFKGSDVYSVADFPDIDYLFISHDHWDHLDHKTVVAFQPKVKKVITGLGVGAHLERWGYSSNKILEKDWNETFTLDDGFTVSTVTARHFSGRGFKRNVSLWLSFVLTTPSMKIFIGGDSGYDKHFKEAGEKFGPFDLAILENGQYDKSWRYIHMMPEEVVQAAQDLKAKKLLPVHWSKFSLSNHAWDEPVQRVVAEASKNNIPILHPMIGEKVNLQQEQAFEPWWLNIK